MLKKILIAAAVVTIPTVSIAADMPYIEEAPATFDDRWAGSYIGVQAGYSSLTAEETGNYKKTVDGPTYGIFAGHNFVFDDILVGVELNADLTNDQTRLTSRSNGQTNWSAGAAMRLGYIMGSYLPYLKAGVGLTEMEGTYLPTGETDSAIHTYFDVGGGFEAMVFEDVSLRLESVYRISSKEDYTLAGFTGGVEADGFITRVGLAYHF